MKRILCWTSFYIIGIFFWLSLFRSLKQETTLEVVTRIKNERELDCIEKTKIYPSRQTGDCKIIRGISPDGRMSFNDCHILDWPYYEFQCGSDIFWGWSAWSTSEDEKNIWIEGKQYYRSCMYTKENQYGCEYNFNKWPKLEENDYVK